MKSYTKFLDNIEKKNRLSFEYFWNMENGTFAPFSIVFSNTWYFKGVIME